MIVKALLALAVATQSSAADPHIYPIWKAAVAEPAVTETGIDPSANPEIVRVDCNKGRGSAVRVGPHVLVSVAHVTDQSGCTINGLPFKVTSKDGDFSVLYSEQVATKWLQVDCNGFKAGKTYAAIGFARGLPVQTTIDVVATGEKLTGFSTLWGVFTVIPGQSGGAMIDSETRKLVGTVNVYDSVRGLSGSVPLSETSVCQKKVV